MRDHHRDDLTELLLQPRFVRVGNNCKGLHLDCEVRVLALERVELLATRVPLGAQARVINSRLRQPSSLACQIVLRVPQIRTSVLQLRALLPQLDDEGGGRLVETVVTTIARAARQTATLA